MPCTSAVRAAGVDRDHAGRARRRRDRARRRRDRGRNRLEVRLASRTGAPGGRAAYDARSRATAAACWSQRHPIASPGQRTPADAGASACVSGSRAPGRSGGVERDRAVAGRPRCTATPDPPRSRSAARSASVTRLGLGEHHRGLEAAGAGRRPPSRRTTWSARSLQRRQVDGARRRRCGRRRRGPRRPRRRRSGRGWRGPG